MIFSPPAPRRDVPRWAAALTLLAVLALLQGCKLGSNEPDALASSRIGQDGGLIGVESGPLAGFRVFLPSGVVTDPVDVSIFLDTIVQVEGFRPVSGVGRIEPSRLEFPGTRRPVVVLPLIDLLIPTSSTESDIRVLHRNGVTGQVDVLTPTSVDLSGLEVRVEAPAFGSFWAAAILNTSQIDLQSHLPLEDGSEWLFESGVRARVTSRTDLPNLVGVPLEELRIDFGSTLDLSFYLQWDSASGNLMEYGIGSVAADRQDVRDTPYQWLGPVGSIGSLVSASTGYRIFEPFGSSTQTDVGTLTSGIELVDFETVNTPAGLFGTALRITVEQSWKPQSSPEELLRLDLWLVPDVGPIMVQLGGSGGLPPVRLIGATTLQSGD